jgi:hypothetical protein
MVHRTREERAVVGLECKRLGMMQAGNEEALNAGRTRAKRPIDYRESIIQGRNRMRRKQLYGVRRQFHPENRGISEAQNGDLQDEAELMS